MPGKKVRIEYDTCTACELCYDRIPEVFKNRGDNIADVVRVDIEESSEVKWMLVPEDLDNDVQEVADECPSGSIIVEDAE